MTTLIFKQNNLNGINKKLKSISV